MAMTLASNALSNISHYTGFSKQSASSGPSATELDAGTSLAVFDAQRPRDESGPTSRLAITGPEDTPDDKSFTVFGAPQPVELSGSPTSQFALPEPEKTQAQGWVEGSVDSDDPDVAGGRTSDLSIKNLGISTSAHQAAREPWGARMEGWANATAVGEPEQSPYGPLAVIDRGTQALIADARNTNEGTQLQLMADPPSENGEFEEEAKLTAGDRIAALTASIKTEQEGLFEKHRSRLQAQGRLGSGNGSQDTILPSECQFPLLSPIQSPRQRPPQGFPARRAPSTGSDGTLFEDDVTVFSAHGPAPACGVSLTLVDQGAKHYKPRLHSMQPPRSPVLTEGSYNKDRGTMTKNTRFQSFLPSRGPRDPGATAAFEKMREAKKTLAAQRQYMAQRDASQQQLVNTVLSALAPRLDDYISACVTARVQMAVDQQLARQSSFATSPGPSAFSPFSDPFGAPPSIFSQSPSRYLAEPVIQTTVVFGAPGAGQSYGAGYQSQAYTNPYASFGGQAVVRSFADPSGYSQYGHGQYRRAPQQFDPYGGIAGASSFAPESLFGISMASQQPLIVGY